MANGSSTRMGWVAALPLVVGLGAAGFESGAPVADRPGAPAAAEESAEEALLASLSTDERDWLELHAFGGLPSVDNIAVHQGYVRSYDPNNRVPRWVAYKVEPSFRQTPKREGRFSTFRTDRSVDNPVSDRNYTGLSASRGYARGHLAPYGVMGGDRNDNGEIAPDDEFDSNTVFQANLMSNIAPQHHAAFNGAGGMWFELERWIQDVVVTGAELEVWVFAGCIFGYGAHERVGPASDIGVPPMFFKIVVRESEDPDDDMPRVLAFLFPHHRAKHGEIQDFLTSVDVIEALSGLNFFNQFGPEVQHALEDADTFENWDGFLPAPA